MLSAGHAAAAAETSQRQGAPALVPLDDLYAELDVSDAAIARDLLRDLDDAALARDLLS